MFLALRLLKVVLCLLCLSCASSSGTASSSTAPAPLPSSHRIPVPFVSFAQATEMKYEHKDILNPSYAAAIAMMLRYGGQDLSLLTKFSDALPEKGGWAIVTQEKDGNLDRVKGYLARDVPVMVAPMWTSVAHPAGPVLDMLATISGVKPAPNLPTSGALLTMRPLEDFATLKRSVGKNFHWESLLMHGRVIVGYDDSRGVILMHDPLFGPGVELPYSEFEEMWSPTDHHFTAVEPRIRPPRSFDTTHTRPRTAAEIGVENFVRAYALESVGRNTLAEGVLRSALALEGLPPEVRYLVLNELGSVAWNLGNESEALRFADQASAIAPESPLTWRLRLEIARKSKAPDAAERRVLAETTLKRLCGDEAALDALYKSLLTYIQIWQIGCK